MILTAHQPSYLPWLGFFHKILISDVFVILDNVQYQKNYFTNRNKIKTAHGYAWLTIPVLTSGHLEKKILEMQIDNKSRWRKKHWKSIEIHYKKSPFFLDHCDYFESLYNKEWINLFELLHETMMYFINKLGIKTEIYLQSDLGFKRKKQDLILEMCDYFNSDIFVFGRDGKRYADPNKFKERNRDIYFQDYNHPIYSQLFGDFNADLSILDLLFNVGSERAVEVIMKDNKSKADLINQYK